MALMRVLSANSLDMPMILGRDFPERVGSLWTPKTLKDPGDGYYVLDNGRYSVWSRGEKWDDGKFLAYLDKTASFDKPPAWVACPDVIGDGKATLVEWDNWYDRLKPYGWPIALIVQEGNTIDDVKTLDNQPDVLFVGGGKPKWTWRYASRWAEAYDRVHIGKVGTYKQLWMADRCGAESCDSNVWRPIGQHLQHLRKYLERSDAGLTETGKPTSGLGL